MNLRLMDIKVNGGLKKPKSKKPTVLTRTDLCVDCDLKSDEVLLRFKDMGYSWASGDVIKPLEHSHITKISRVMSKLNPETLHIMYCGSKSCEQCRLYSDCNRLLISENEFLEGTADRSATRLEP